jgi:hypothetical protein
VVDTDKGSTVVVVLVQNVVALGCVQRRCHAGDAVSTNNSPT